MSNANVATLQSAGELSQSSKSLSSQGLRNYVRIVSQEKSRFQFMMTDIRDIKTPIEAETGRVFKALA